MAAKPVLLRGGHVIDPGNGIDKIMDVLLENGKVAGVDININLPGLDCKVFDATGYIVCPGLVDSHVHCFPNGSSLGIDPDKCCLSRGVTTVFDAGSSGAKNFSRFVEFSKTKKVRILMFVHASRVGLELAGCATADVPGELESLDDVDEKECLECIGNYPTNIVGVKIRLSNFIANHGKHEMEAFRRALSICTKANLPIMVHHSFSTVPLESMGNDVLGAPGSLREGDIYTHTYHGFESTIIDTTSHTVNSSVLSAKERGVYFDVGHGMGAFNWKVADLAIETEGLWPDTISTDLHIECSNGPAYDLPTVMTKFLHLGMSLYDVIKATTFTPACMVKKQDEFGTLSIGASGDVTVLELKDCDVMLEDCQMYLRRVKQRLVPVAAWRGGERVDISDPWTEWPNKSEEYWKHQMRERNLLYVQ